MTALLLSIKSLHFFAFLFLALFWRVHWYHSCSNYFNRSTSNNGEKGILRTIFFIPKTLGIPSVFVFSTFY